jgi:signal transduction histidine kinase
MITTIGYLTPFGLLIFIVFQSIILSRRYSIAFNTIEQQSQELKKTNEAFREEISMRQRTENALRASHERFLTVLDSIDATIYVSDIDTYEILFMNQYMKDQFGGDLVGMTCYKVFRNESEPCEDCPNSKLFNHEGQPTGVYTWEGRNPITGKVFINHDRAIRWTNAKYARIQIAIDITERKKTEEMLRKSEAKLARSKKMRSLGLLAGGVAHDLNNILSGIVGYPELILLDLPQDSPIKSAIEAIKDSGNSAAAIVQDLLTVAQGVAIAKEALNLNDLIKDYLNSPEYRKLVEFHPRIEVRTKLDKGLFNINGSPVHVRKVLMNLVSNASEAIEGPGHITITTTNRYIDRPLKGYDDVAKGEYTVLAVSDTGSGISHEDLEGIFEPFYTKKVMGRSGTGLGLAVVWNVVQDHEGYIDVISNEQGTTFELYFPITRDKVPDKDLSLPMKEYQGNGEKILVVDDEESQRIICRQMLETLGYEVETVSSGEEAVAYLKVNTVDLVLLDMIMDPGISGRETYERIVEINPRQKAIIVSGFAETDDVRAAQKLGAGSFVKKPVTLAKIGLAVKEEMSK